MKHAMILAAVLVGWGMLASPARAELALVRDGQEPCPIYHPARPQPQERTAAQELAAYLKAITGVAFSVQAAPTGLPERGIFVGPAAAEMAEGLAAEDFRLRVEGQRLHIVGGSPRGTLYGVFALLEDDLGCRWWSRNEEDVPAGKTTLVLPDMDRTVRRPFEMARIWSKEATSTENNFCFKARTHVTGHIEGGHTLYPLLKSYAAQHPDIFPMNKQGVRKGNDLHFCYLAPGIAEALADAIGREVQRNKGNVTDVLYFAGMGDWYGGMCECEACKAVYAEETWTDPDGRVKPGYTATLLRMVNKTAEMLEQRYPGIRICTLAYMSLEAPPAVTRPRENVVIRIPRLRHCTVHAVEECNTNAGFRRNLERWGEIAPRRVDVWEYTVNFGTNFIEPFPSLYSMAGNIAFYRKAGVRGLELQGNYVSTGGDLVVLKNYVWRKLLWNPELDPKALAREFCEGYYGPAAQPMMAYVEALEKSVREPKRISASEFDKPTYLTPEVRRDMRRLREEARRAAAGRDPYTRRVLEGTVGMEALALWKVGPLREEGDQLIRADLGEYSYPRALEMLKYTREASPREWGLFRAYHQTVPSMHGGPLPRLARGDVEVKIAPALSGRIRQLSYQGAPLLYVETDAGTKGYPQLGGSEINARTTLYTLEGTPTERQVKMVGESGIGGWSPTTKQVIRQTVEMNEDGAIDITAAARTVAEKVENRGTTVTTAYLAPKNPADVRVEVMAADGQWAPVAFAAGSADIPLKGVAAIKVCFPRQQCQVIDRYLTPAVAGGTITHDAKKGILTTVVSTGAVAAPKEEEVVFLRRRIEVQPLQ